MTKTLITKDEDYNYLSLFFCHVSTSFTSPDRLTKRHLMDASNPIAKRRSGLCVHARPTAKTGKEVTRGNKLALLPACPQPPRLEAPAAQPGPVPTSLDFPERPTTHFGTSAGVE